MHLTILVVHVFKVLNFHINSFVPIFETANPLGSAKLMSLIFSSFYKSLKI